jgi:hypothetical protein
MSSLSINYYQTQRRVHEYGQPMEAVDQFIALVPSSMHGGSVDIALALVCNDERMILAPQVQVETAVKLADGSFKVTGTRTRLNVARRQDNFRLQFRSSLTTGETAVDANGNPIYVTLDELNTATLSPQIKTMSRDVPVYDVTCVGIRDITPIGTPARLQSLWIGGVNSGIFDAFEGANIGAGGLICAGVDCQPHFISNSTQYYRIQFRFVGSDNGWREYIYWKDPITGLPPADFTPANWSRLIQLYKEFDYQTAWPFGDDVG